MNQDYQECPYPVIGYKGEHIFDTDEKMTFKADMQGWQKLVSAVRGLQAHDKSCSDPNWEDDLTKFYYIGFVKGQTTTFTIRRTMSGNGRGQPYWMMYLSRKSKRYQKYVCIYGQLTVEALQNAVKHIEGKIKEYEKGAKNVRETNRIA